MINGPNHFTLNFLESVLNTLRIVFLILHHLPFSFLPTLCPYLLLNRKVHIFSPGSTLAELTDVVYLPLSLGILLPDYSLLMNGWPRCKPTSRLAVLFPSFVLHWVGLMVIWVHDLNMHPHFLHHVGSILDRRKYR